MADDTAALPNPNPWRPITNPLDLKHLGKLNEEANELGAAISRCIIQGVDEAEPVTGKVNRDWLQDEIADVLANIELVTAHFGLDEAAMRKRSLKKMAQLRVWFAMSEQPAPEAFGQFTPT